MKKAVKISVVKIITVTVMGFCLLVLTGANFIIYPPAHSFASCLSGTAHSNEEQCPNPVEEKSSSKTAVTTQEEYIHDLHSINELSAFLITSKHTIPVIEKLQVIHFELVSPPPEI